ncbi:MAG: TetR/AcrR family transcriptional regulator [Microthrixaceae bacterium]|nr:TetR/AcrR family transcriptional regulator [Microthrixaceae bacterium]MCO5312029.1 TetR/AcrR family transcriptional regulator [Microthrixaceae bacterium]
MAETSRRTQQDRSAATQRALLDATIECLVEYGYAGTTTRLVAERAQVSRGAQTHHYPTKRDLVVAAVERLFDEQARHFTSAFDQVDPTVRTLEHAVEALWEIATGPAYAAVLEVLVAARTDEELRVVVHGVAAALETTVVDLLMWFAPAITDRDIARRLVGLVFTLVQGGAVSRLGGFGQPDEVIRLATSMIDVALAAVIAPTTEPTAPSEALSTTVATTPHRDTQPTRTNLSEDRP